MPYREPVEPPPSSRGKPRDEKSHMRPPAIEAEWWRAEELGVRPDEILDNLVRQLEDDQTSRYDAYREYARMFGSDPDMFGYDDSFSILQLEEVTQNELANTIETLHAQVFKNKIVPAISCSEANWEEWERGKAFSRWLEGMFDRSEAHYDAIPRAGLDALVYGTGFIKVGHEEDEEGNVHLTHTRIDPRMVLVDRLEARHGKPRSKFVKDYVDKFKLADDYCGCGKDLYVPKGMTPKEAAENRVKLILESKSNDDVDMALGARVKCEMVTVREAWHLPTSPKCKNGRHVIWIRGCTLVDEPYSWSRFPLSAIRYGHRLSGYYGDSAVKRLAPTQKQFDKLNKKIDEAQDIMGVPRIIANRESGLQKGDIDDLPGVLFVNMPIDQAVKDWNATAVSPELYQERGDAPRKMRSLLGVSDFDVQNQLPSSMREVSAPALERWVDSGTARHEQFHSELERLMMDLALLSLDYAAELEKEGKDLFVAAPGEHEKTSVEFLKFSEVKVARNRFKLRVQPMNQLPQTFAGKVEALSKLRESGDLTSKQFLRMLEVPDYNSTVDYLTSDEDIIQKNLCFMARKKKYLPPLQDDNLDLIIPMATAFINHYRTREDADMQVVGMLNQYIESARRLKAGLGGADPNAPPPPMGPMGGAPMPPMGPDGMPTMDPSMAGMPMGPEPPPMGGQIPMGPPPGGPMPM